MENIIAITKRVAFVFNTNDQAAAEEFMIQIGYSTRSYYLDFKLPPKSIFTTLVSVTITDTRRIFTIGGENDYAK